MNELRDQLQEIYDDNGQLTPLLVVDTARPEDHPLHVRFEWDNAVAGERWRQTQAHELIRSVRVTYQRADRSMGEVRAFHAVRGQDGHVYEPIEKITADPLLTEMLRRDMEREWRTLKVRYEHFEEFRLLVAGDLGLAS